MNDQITLGLKAKETTGEHISDLFQGLFPAWPTIIATILAFIVLVTVMYKLVWHPVRKMVKDRHDFIQKNIDESIISNTDAKKQRERAFTMLSDSRNTARDHIENAKIEGTEVKDALIAEAQLKANKLIATAYQEIAAQKINMQKELHAETVDLAIAAAEKIIAKSIDNKTNRKLIKEFIVEEADNQ